MRHCSHARRRLALAALAAFATPAWAQPSPAIAGADRLRFAGRAMALRDEAVRRGDQPYGAVVVCNGTIVGEGISAVVTAGDVDAHAERLALRDAARALRRGDLSDCLLFGSSRACPLCEAAAYRQRIARMYFGADGADAGAPRAVSL
ncbi:MAG: deaminase [Burkholderiales bacterium]